MHAAAVTSPDELRDLCGDDGLVTWVAQAFGPRVRAWRTRGAVAVACPDLSRRDRLAVHGRPAAASDLVREVLPVVGASFRVIADTQLVRSIVAASGDLEMVAEFDWMETTCRADPCPPRPGLFVGWLESGRLADVAGLLAEAFPDSNAHPDREGFRRWAGAWDRDGRLVSAGADAWSTPGVGFIAGVATRLGYRGAGAATAVCRLLVDTLVAEHGRAALMVDRTNEPAIAVYRRLGMRARAIAAARVRT